MRLEELPALPVVVFVLVPMAAIVLLLAVLLMARRGSLTVLRGALVAALLVYAIGMLRSVLLPYPIVLGADRSALPTWDVFVQPVPLATVPDDPSGMLLNVLLFLPLGVMLPMLLRRPSLLRTVGCGLLVSLLIETVQLLGDVTVSTGRVADVDDLIGNTAGTAIGFAIFVLLTRVPTIHRVAAAAALGGGPSAGEPVTTERAAAQTGG